MKHNHARPRTIVGVKKDGKVAIAGDGQVTLDKTVMKKHGPRRSGGSTRARCWPAFAGSAADAMALADRFEAKLEASNGNLQRAVIEFAKEWRSDRVPAAASRR